MECNRIQKLLSSEYSDFSDDILVESPFAETTRNGRGIRQVSLGLTPSKLIIAADVFKNNSEFFCPRNLDPSIESFELVSVYPLQYVALGVFSRRHRKTLKARFVDGKTNYYELGGIQRRMLSWKKWCEQVESLLVKRMDGSSLSESTAASSSSSTTLYIFSSEIEVQKETRKGKKTVCRIWAHYGGAGDYARCTPPIWTQKDLYLGPSYDEITFGQYAPVPVRFAGASLEEVKEELKDFSPNKVEKPSRSWPTCQWFEKNKNTDGLCDVLFIRDHNRKYFNANKFYTTCQSCPCNHLQGKIFSEYKVGEKRNAWYNDQALKETSLKKEILREEQRSPRKYPARRISRFGFGVPEKCHSGLVLGPTRRDRDFYSLKPDTKQNFYVLMENGVKVWEGEGNGCCKSSKRSRHFRRYGLCTAAHFLYAMGPWSVQPGERSLLLGRRSFSLVSIRRQSADSELRLPVSRRQLAASISYTVLQSGRFGSIGASTKGRVVLFWTPEYWYRPRPAAAAYRELRQHLNHLRSFRQDKERPAKRKLFYKKKRCQCEGKDCYITTEEKPSFLERIFSTNGSSKRKKKYENHENGTTVQLRRLLRMDFRITIWDIDSTTLATQLTLIDRELFVRIPAEEIEILIFQRSSRNAPNLAAWIAFSHRISCLTVSEVLAIKKLDVRSRIIARLINAASKCFAMGNFHSCRSILAGLQAPPIYRLRSSWSYLRIHHASRYETMEKLCKIYKSPYALAYQRAWTKAEKKPPCLPYVGDLLTKLLGLSSTKRHRQYDNLLVIKNKVSQQRSKDMALTDTNKNIPNIKSNENLEQKQGLSKRILVSVLTKIKYKKGQKAIYEKKVDLLWTTREQDLAWKYFYHWYNIVLKRKALAKEQERLNGMDPRLKRVLEVVSWLVDCQKRTQGYDFPGHSFTREFLLKARYREDRENFFISLKLEPLKIT